MGMAKLLKDLYHTYQVGTCPQCRAAAAAFREHCAPRSASHYLLFLDEDADHVLDDIWPFGLAMFSNDIVQSLNRFLKQAFNEHSARGGGRQTATGTASCGRSQASIDSDADALRQVLQWEAHKAVEVLERELQGMGGGVQVKQEGGDNDDDIVELGEVVVDEKDEERRANPGVKREEEEGGGDEDGEGDGDGEGEGDDAGGVLRITDWMRNRLGSSPAAKAANFPWTREMVGPNPPPPWTPVSYEPPTPPFTRSVGCCSASCTSNCTARSSVIAAGAGRRGPRQGGSRCPG